MPEQVLLAVVQIANGTHISSGFGWRKHPIFGFLEFHEGIDVAAPYGTPIRVLTAGVIEEEGSKGGYGLYVRVRHSLTYATAYAHLSDFGAGVHAGARLKRGDILGYVGSTGCSTGNHLHLEIILNGARVNPACGFSPAPPHPPDQASLTGQIPAKENQNDQREATRSPSQRRLYEKH